MEGGRERPAWAKTFDRQTSEFVITNPRHSLSPAEVTIESPQQRLRVGEFLNREDIDKLIELIKSSGSRYRVTGKTQIHAIDGFEL